MVIPQRNHQSYCAVCDGSPFGSRYGPVTCLGCTVFFRRSVQNGKIHIGEKSCVCEHSFNLKTPCRSCRLQKCLDSGMNPKAVRHRDKWGPRKSETRTRSSFITTDRVFDDLLQLQKKQRNRHEMYRKTKINRDGIDVVKIKRKPYHRAGVHDIDLALTLGFQNATEWGNQFELFLNLKRREKKLVLSEFGIAFILIDQAFKTVYMEKKGFWLLQNDSFLHTDYFLGASIKEAQKENSSYELRKHSDFVNGLLKGLNEPFLNLQIDEFECVVLKTLLLLTPSFPEKLKVEDSEKIVSKCMTEMMNYSIKKSPINGVERFGEIILLMRSIRCAVKSFYNQTKILDMFDVSKFDSFVRESLLS